MVVASDVRSDLEVATGRDEAVGVVPERGREGLLAVGCRTLDELRQAMLARPPMEREIARLAAVKAQPEQLALLRRIFAARRDNLKAGGTERPRDWPFHEALAEASGNRFLAIALHVIRTGSDSLAALMFDLGSSIGGDSLSHHAETLDAVAIHDPNLAGEFVVRYINDLIRHIDTCLTASSRPASPRAPVAGGTTARLLAALGPDGSRSNGHELASAGTSREPASASWVELKRQSCRREGAAVDSAVTTITDRRTVKV